MITKIQFDILVFIDSQKSDVTQRKIATMLEVSLGKINQNVKELENLNFLCDYNITEEGYNVLNTFKVKRVVFIAAGFGSRLVPITLNTPKPLILVRGKMMIETLLDRVTELGIEEVIIVRGYLARYFDILLTKYPNIKFIENDLYNDANNISSVLLAKDYLCNSYIMEADLFLMNPDIITKYQYSSNYLAIDIPKTNDWCFEVEKNYIKKYKQGGINCPQAVGISYWTEEDGKKLAIDVEEIYNQPGGTSRFWDEVPLTYKRSNYNVEIRTCKLEDIIEIDSYSELKDFDEHYR